MRTKFLGPVGNTAWNPSYSKRATQRFKPCNIDIPNHRLLVFELGYTGHYPSYIRYLAQYWCEQELPGHLDIVVSPEFVQHHADVMGIAAHYKHSSLTFISINPGEAASLMPRKSSIYRAFRSFQEWHLLRKYATALGASHCLLLYFDSFQSAVASRAKLPCPFSGIYFRPTFHYTTFAHYLPSLKERVQHWREKLTLPQILHHPQLQNLFCLDPFVVKHLEQFSGKTRAVYLPDPVPIHNAPDHQLGQFKTSLGINPGRKVFLLFGALYDGRKGLHQLLEAISLLAPALCQQLCLLLVGQVGDGSHLQTRIAEISRDLPLQVIVRDDFVPESEVQLYFQLADFVLAPYQRHVGMSGILVRAAAAQKPILTSDYGLMGEITRHWQLGVAVDSTVPGEIAKGLTQFLLNPPAELGDRTKMKTFAQQNSTEQFAGMIFQHLQTVSTELNESSEVVAVG